MVHGVANRSLLGSPAGREGMPGGTTEGERD